MVSVQIPQGFTVDDGFLHQLKQQKIVEEYDLGYDRLEIYIRNFRPSETKTINIKMRARYPVTVNTGSINVYDYYNPEIKSRLEPVTVNVGM